MVRGTSQRVNDLDELTADQRARAADADSIYRKVCDDLGMQVCSWQTFDAWQEYLDEKIGETQLAEKARSELQQFSQTFGKYLVVDKADRQYEEQEAEKKERAKRANKIYKKVCDENGMTACFFRDFSTWREYVKGSMEESEFYEKAKIELEKMLEERVSNE